MAGTLGQRITEQDTSVEEFICPESYELSFISAVLR
jgi:hypothetical protein